MSYVGDEIAKTKDHRYIQVDGNSQYANCVIIKVNKSLNAYHVAFNNYAFRLEIRLNK